MSTAFETDYRRCWAWMWSTSLLARCVAENLLRASTNRPLKDERREKHPQAKLWSDDARNRLAFLQTTPLEGHSPSLAPADPTTFQKRPHGAW